MVHHYGDAKASDRLKRARLAAGFRTSRAATTRFGWPQGTYLGHEAGTRRIPEAALARYAKAFEVPEEWLATGETAASRRDARMAMIAGASLDELAGEAKGAPDAGSAASGGRRLRIARLMAGFATPGAAAKHFRFRRAALAAYEADKARVSVAMAAVYGYAYAADPHWLRTGEPPSGLDDPADENLEALERAVARGAPPSTDPARLGDPRAVEAMDRMEALRIAKRSADPELAARIPEWNAASGQALTEWTVPSGLLSHVEPRRREGLAIVSVAAVLGGGTRVRLGDRIVVQIGRDAVEGCAAAYLDAGLERFVVAEPGRTDMPTIGSVVMLLSGAA